MIRHPLNNNLHLFYKSEYRGWPVQISKGPLISEYLDLLYETMNNALSQYSRVFAFRVDLRFPTFLDVSPHFQSNAVVERFIESFKAKNRHNRSQAKKDFARVHDSRVRYVWAREVGLLGRPHFHFVFFLNQQAYSALGYYEYGRDNIYNRLHASWASALGFPVDSVRGCVEFPDSPCYILKRDDVDSMAKFFYRASYLCKSATKNYGTGRHCFGASRG